MPRHCHRTRPCRRPPRILMPGVGTLSLAATLGPVAKPAPRTGYMVFNGHPFHFNGSPGTFNYLPENE